MPKIKAVFLRGVMFAAFLSAAAGLPSVQAKEQDCSRLPDILEHGNLIESREYQTSAKDLYVAPKLCGSGLREFLEDGTAAVTVRMTEQCAETGYEVVRTTLFCKAGAQMAQITTRCEVGGVVYEPCRIPLLLQAVWKVPAVKKPVT